MNQMSLMADHQKLARLARTLEDAIRRHEDLCDRMEAALETVEAKRGPGRPRKDAA